MPLGKLQTLSANKLLASFSEDIAIVYDSTISSLWQSLSALFFIPIGIGILFYLNWQLTLLVVVLMPITMLISQFYFKKANKTTETKKGDDAKFFAFVQQDIATQLSIRILQIFTLRSKTFNENLNATEKNDFRYQFFTALSKSILSSGQIGIWFGILVVGGFFVLNGSLTIGALISFSVLLYGVITYIHRCVDHMQKLLLASNKLNNILEIINCNADKIKNEQKPELRNFAHHICFNKVNFKYPNSKFALHEIDLKFSIGESVAIAGPSGSGKSTLIRLLLGQENPTKGKIEIDMSDLIKYNFNPFLNQVGVILQVPDLFNMSIADNIRLGKLEATNEEIIAAAKAAEIHDEIMLLKDSYDSIIDEQNIVLPDVQRKRIVIARALIKNPSILVIDDITAGLDSTDQIAINKTIARHCKDRTIIRITHNLSETIGMDKIYILHDGRIISTGTHEELLQSTDSLYYNLWNKQASLESILD
jgi:ATP-binding cassette subfamily B protein